MARMAIVHEAQFEPLAGGSFQQQLRLVRRLDRIFIHLGNVIPRSEARTLGCAGVLDTGDDEAGARRVYGSKAGEYFGNFGMRGRQQPGTAERCKDDGATGGKAKSGQHS